MSNKLEGLAPISKNHAKNDSFLGTMLRSLGCVFFAQLIDLSYNDVKCGKIHVTLRWLPTVWYSL